MSVRSAGATPLNDPSIAQPREFAGHAIKVIQFAWTHPANKGSQARALVRLARFQVRGRLFHKPTLARLGERSRIWAVVHRRGSAKALYANPPDYPEMLVWRRHIQPGDLFVDVGANVGTYSIWAGELGAETIAIEPAVDTFELLQENIRLNRHNVTPLRAAAGSSAGVVRFTEGRDSVNRIDPEGTTEVPVVTVDSVVGERVVAGLKIDVEGFEIDVLRGAEKALAEHRIQLIQLEWNDTSESAVGSDRRPVADLLSSCGYGLYRPDVTGTLQPISDHGFGDDVFAKPEAAPAVGANP